MPELSLVDQLYAARKSKSAGVKAAANRRFNKYVSERVAAGKSEKMVRAGIEAALTKKDS